MTMERFCLYPLIFKWPDTKVYEERMYELIHRNIKETMEEIEALMNIEYAQALIDNAQ